MQCSCKPFVILILAIYQKSLGFSSKCWVFCCRVHSKLGQDKCAKTVKVDISSSYLTPVLFKECDDTEKPILSFLMCTVSAWASEHYTRLFCCVSVPSLESWLDHRQNDTGTAGQGSQTTLKCPGTQCSGWMEEVIKSPLTHTLCLYVSISGCLWHSL